MAKVSEMMSSKYLKKDHIDEDMLVTVQGVKQVNVAKEGEAQEMKWVLKFKEFTPPMVLNSTNIRRLGDALGDDSDDWTGKQVVLYVDPDVSMGGKVTGGLRIRAAKKVKPAAKIVEDAEDNLDDVPF